MNLEPWPASTSVTPGLAHGEVAAAAHLASARHQALRRHRHAVQEAGARIVLAGFALDLDDHRPERAICPNLAAQDDQGARRVRRLALVEQLEIALSRAAGPDEIGVMGAAAGGGDVDAPTFAAAVEGGNRAHLASAELRWRPGSRSRLGAAGERQHRHCDHRAHSEILPLSFPEAANAARGSRLPRAVDCKARPGCHDRTISMRKGGATGCVGLELRRR